MYQALIPHTVMHSITRVITKELVYGMFKHVHVLAMLQSGDPDVVAVLIHYAIQYLVRIRVSMG